MAACKKDDETAGKTVVKVAFYAAGFGTSWMEDAKARYEAEHSDVYLKLEGDPYIEETVKQRLDTKNANLADDLCVFGGGYYRYMVRNDLLKDLTSFYDETVEGEDTVDDLVNQQLKNYFTVNGKVYGIPWQDNAMSFVYNANMFDQYGWEIPETMDQFFRLCEKIATIRTEKSIRSPIAERRIRAISPGSWKTGWRSTKARRRCTIFWTAKTPKYIRRRSPEGRKYIRQLPKSFTAPIPRAAAM